MITLKGNKAEYNFTMRIIACFLSCNILLNLIEKNHAIYSELGFSSLTKSLVLSLSKKQSNKKIHSIF